jgi:hypothetical protein
MPRIRLILEDDDGNTTPTAAERLYRLEGDLDTLDQIEQAVETFKKQALPDIEHSLLDQAQERFVARGKKSERRRPPAAP